MSIQIVNMTHTYMPGTPFESTALKEINLQMDQSEFIGMIGHTGSGKSTLVQHINGLLRPTEGKLVVYGIDLSQKNADLKKVRNTVGLVFQYPEHQLFEETVEADIAFGPKNMGVTGEELKERVHEAMRLVGLREDTATRSPFEMSGGQRRRVAIAGVVAMRPQFLILDEPTAGLDPQGREDILRLVQRLHSEGTGVLMVTHNMNDIARIADRVIVIDYGRIRFDGTPREVFSHVDELEEMGLDVPDASKLRRMLKDVMPDFPDDLFDAEGVAAYLLQRMRGDRHDE